MLKIYTAFTREMDDPELAAKEILEQLQPEQNMLKTTVGIVHFYHEFVETGACKAIIDAFPFEIVGCVTSYVGSCQTYDDLALSFTMITGDDFEISVKMIEDCNNRNRDEIAAETKKILSDFSKNEKPKVVLPYLSAMQNFSGDDVVAISNDLPEIVPLFGTIAFNMDNITDNHYTLGKGKFSKDALVLLALYGDFEPKFNITSSFDFEDGIGEVATIEEADGTILKTINGMTAVEYLRKLGMTTTNNLVEGSVWALPSVLHYANGTRIVRAFLGVIPGTEYIFASGEMEKGANIAFNYLDAEKTLASTNKLMQEVITGKENGILIYSCSARAWSLGSNHFAETQIVEEQAAKYEEINGEKLNYCIAYSGGEISPIRDNNGKLINAMHNYTLISCAFN